MSEPLVRAHIGWSGQFTTSQAEGAYPNGTRIRKIRSEPNDSQRNGATGRVLGSIRSERLPGVIGYFVEWDAMPTMAVFIVSTRLARCTEEERKVHVWAAGTPLRGRP